MWSYWRGGHGVKIYFYILLYIVIYRLFRRRVTEPSPKDRRRNEDFIVVCADDFFSSFPPYNPSILVYSINFFIKYIIYTPYSPHYGFLWGNERSPLWFFMGQ